MPPRHAYWTILIDGQPTAFRAHDPEELLPTLNRLREKNASASMKWFERGQLFDSRDAAREAGMGKGERRWEGPRPERRDEGSGEPRRTASEDRRDKNWRPGGEHRDSRQPYKDAKKAKWTRFKKNIRERHERRAARDPETFSPPHGDPLRDTYRDRPRQRFDDRGQRRNGDDRWRNDRREDRGQSRDGEDRWRSDRREDRDGAPSRPDGDRFRDQRPRQNWRPRDDDRRPERNQDRRFETRDTERHERHERRERPPRRDEERREWRPKGPGDRPPGGGGGRPSSRAPFGARAKGVGAKSGGAKPFAKNPFGKRPAARRPPGKKPFGTGRRRDEDE